MARNICSAKKSRLAKLGRQTRWAPFWTIPKIYGANKKIHPGRHTVVKRTWKRGSTKV
ncbi:hypothetical protein JXA48_04565 [Candidatus Woesearchaeota archaeon]|nr:hypothetical protein [Candidatus Woesearchaeota archaeon]